MPRPGSEATRTSLVISGVRGERFYVGRGTKKDPLQGFFDRLTKEQEALVAAVGMDRPERWTGKSMN